MRCGPFRWIEQIEEIREVLRRFIPEIAAGTVEIVALARIVGRRCLLAVRSHDPKVSAVQACSFGRGERLDGIIAELGGEFPSVMQWHSSPEAFIRNAFGGLNRVVLDPGTRQAVVTIHPIERNRVMVRNEDQIVRMHSELTVLVSELTGWKVSLADTEKV